MPQSFTPDLIKILRKNGCVFVRNGKGDHQVWSGADGQPLIVDSFIRSRHTANAILKQAGLKKAF